MMVMHDVCPDCGKEDGKGWIKAAQFCVKCMRGGSSEPAINVTLVYYREGINCIERVTVVNNTAHIHKMTLVEALNAQADLSQLTARMAHRAAHV